MARAVAVSVVPILGRACDLAIVGHHEGLQTGNNGGHYAIADFELSAGDGGRREEG